MASGIRKKLWKAAGVAKKTFQKPPKMKFMYGWYYKHAPIQEKQILFESFHGKDLSDSPFYILTEFLKMADADQYKIYFATNNYAEHKKTAEAMGLPVELVDITTFKYTKVLATSKYLINNSSFPAYFIRREEQTYLQTWHGTPLKTLGKKMRFGIESMYNVQHNFLQANYIMFPNKFTKEVMMEDYNLNSLYTGKVVMNGYPRNSLFKNKEKAQEICRKLENEKFTTLAYMPTWRGQSNHDIQTENYGKEINAMLKYLDEHLKDHQKLYVNFHPIVQKNVTLESYQHIFAFPADIDKYEFLNSVDALITDYSSVFFDYSVTGKPVILFMYDYEEYMHDRGMYFDIKELPFRKIYDLEILKDCIVSEDFRGDRYDKNEEYMEKFLAYDSADAARKMAELIFKDQTENLEIIDYSANGVPERRVVFPPSIRNPETLDAVVKNVDSEKDIVVFERRFFNPFMSSYLHDHYADEFDYIFISKTLPRTFLEEIWSKFSKKTVKELHLREIQRCFPGLNINPVFQREYYSGIESETYYFAKDDLLNCEISGSVHTLCIRYPWSKEYRITKLMVVQKTKARNLIVWTRDLTLREQEAGEVYENFRAVMDTRAIVKNTRYVIAFEYENTGNGQKGVMYPVDEEKYKDALENIDKLNCQALYFPAIAHGNVTLKDGLEYEQIFAVPYINADTGKLLLQASPPENVLGKYMHGQLLKFSVKNSSISLKIKVKKINGAIKDVVLKYRSPVIDTQYSMDIKVNLNEGYWIIDAQMDLQNVTLEELYWDVFVIIQRDEEDLSLGVRLSKWQKKKLLLGNYQCYPNETHVVYPYEKKGGNIAFTYRERSKYDGTATRIKEFLVFGAYALLLPYWKGKRMWLVYEKFCSMAQDNGYYFFKYCMENLPEEEKKHIYFILDKESPDWEKMQKYKDHVIPFMSMRHMLYCMVAKLYVGSDSKIHLYAWRAKPNLISRRVSHHKILFLQHGVTALKRVDKIFGKKGSSPMTYFTTTSEFEQKIIMENFGYTRENAPILGFTRWDVLEDTSRKEEKIVLVMPTWRSWLEEKSTEEFRESDYYKNYSHFLQSGKLSRILKQYDTKLIFYIHPKFKDYLGEFNISQDNVELIPFGTQPLNEIIKKCHMLITDYSSVCWDVYYLGKPVLFYQFDCDMYMQAHGSYLDMENELFGERYMECDDLIDGIEEYMKRDFLEKDKYGEMRDYYLPYRDNDNSKRTYEYIISQGY